MRNTMRALLGAALAAGFLLIVLAAAHHNGRSGKAVGTSTPPSATTPASGSRVTTSPPSMPPLTATVTWTVQCPRGQRFCATFPGIAYAHDVYDSATSVTGKDDAYVSTVYRTPNGQFCTTEEDRRCSLETSVTYFVQVITSKYRDPWTALTSINGGIKHPIRTTVQGNLAAKFDKGLYGGPGYTVYYKGRVYYLEAASLSTRKFPEIGRFLASLRFS